VAQHGAASLIHGGNRDTEETDTRRPRPHGTRCDETLCDRFTRRGGFLDARLWVWARLWRAAASWASRWMRGQKRACESAVMYGADHDAVNGRACGCGHGFGLGSWEGWAAAGSSDDDRISGVSQCVTLEGSRVGHGADLVEPLLVADGDALVLAEVLVPGGDNELFDDPARVGGVLPGARRWLQCSAG